MNTGVIRTFLEFRMLKNGRTFMEEMKVHISNNIMKLGDHLEMFFTEF
jgi:hypothetical protein